MIRDWEQSTDDHCMTAASSAELQEIFADSVAPSYRGQSCEELNNHQNLPSNCQTCPDELFGLDFPLMIRSSGSHSLSKPLSG